jgi:hypothetical protein
MTLEVTIADGLIVIPTGATPSLTLEPQAAIKLAIELLRAVNALEAADNTRNWNPWVVRRKLKP